MADAGSWGGMRLVAHSGRHTSGKRLAAQLRARGGMRLGRTCGARRGVHPVVPATARPGFDIDCYRVGTARGSARGLERYRPPVLGPGRSLPTAVGRMACSKLATANWSTISV
jgi:hypothetical protein